MALRVVQPGSGSVRPLVLVYLANDATFDLPSNVAVVADDGPPGADTTVRSNYYLALPALADVLATLSQELGASFSPVVLAGFSAGGFAVKRFLDLGADPDAVVLADATYGGDLVSWTKYAARAKAGERVMSASYSMGTSRPWENLESITGLNLAYGTPTTVRSGNLVVHGYANGDHRAQGATVLPSVLVPEVLAQLPVPSGSSRWWLAALFGGVAAISYAWTARRMKQRHAFAEPNPTLSITGDDLRATTFFHGTRAVHIDQLRPSTGGEFGPGIYLTSFEP